MSGLSTQQQAVAQFILTGRGSLNLKARAGCGKTHAVVHAVIKTIYEKFPRAEVAAMAYNKAAGGELSERVEKIGINDWRRVQTGTVHSFGLKAWKKVAPAVVVDDKKVLKILDQLATDDGTGEINDCSPYRRFGSVIRQTVSLAKQRAFGFLTPLRDRSAWYDLIDHFGLDDDLPEDFEIDDLIEYALNVLDISLGQDYQVIDFDDMILAPLVHKARFWGKDFVIIDEAQDTNPARRALAMAMLKPRTGRLIAVGDDRQAIYGFTGADGDAMDIIAKTMGSITLPLNVTYRCPRSVVELAQNLVPDFTAHPSAPEGVVRSLPFVVEIPNEGPYTTPNVPAHIEKYWYEGENLGHGDVILCRNTKPLIEQAYQLIRAGIGCMVEGRDIGKGLIGLATKWSRVRTLTALSTKLEEYREREMTKWLAKGREEKADQVEDRVGTLQTIIEKCLGDRKTEVTDLVRDIESLFGDSADKDAKKTLLLATIHRSKGREWRRVYGLGRARFLPSQYARKDWQVRQEENLEYVLLTRAMEEYIDVVLS